MDSNFFIIDSHQHFWKYQPQRHSWISNKKIQRDFHPEELEPILKKNKVEGCITVQVEASEEETLQLLEFADRFDFIKGVVGWLNPCGTNLEEKLEVYSNFSMFKGIRHTVYDREGEFMLEPRFKEGIRKFQQYGLHFELLVFPYQLPAAIRLVRMFPEQRFVLNHLGKPEIHAAPSEDWRRHLGELAACENVAAKISGLVTQVRDLPWTQQKLEPYLEVLLEAFGPHRLMFGSDWPVCTSVATYEETLGIVKTFFRGRSDTEKQAVFRDTAVRVYRL